MANNKWKSSKLTEKQNRDVNTVINTCSALTGAAGFAGAQLPIADNLVITPIQIAMIIGIGKVMGVKIPEGVANGIIKSAAAAFIGRGISQIAFAILPGISNGANTVTAVALTQFIGRLAVKDFIKNADKYEKEDREYSAEDIANDIKERFGNKKNSNAENTDNATSQTQTENKSNVSDDISASINEDLNWED